VLALQPISARYWLVPSDEIRLYAIDMLLTRSDYGTETGIAPIEANGVYSFDLHLICSENGLETFGATSD